MGFVRNLAKGANLKAPRNAGPTLLPTGATDVPVSSKRRARAAVLQDELPSCLSRGSAALGA
jgi:hypothetical protein